MSRFRILDVETIAHPDAHLWVDPVRPDSRLKDPAKIAESIKEKTAERDERLALDIDCNRIVCLGYKDTDGDDPIVDICQDELAEALALTRFWNSYREKDTKLVTFYGLGFDLPVIMRRSLYLGVKYPTLNIDRFRTTHIDICQKLSFNGVMKTHSLKFYCRRFGIETNDPFDGAQVAELVKAGLWDDVAYHCTADIGATHQLALKLGLLS